MTMATTRSGDVTKEWVAGFPSLRPVKFRLYDDRIELASPFLTSRRSHWPMQGPQALARTIPPNSSNVSSWPSLAMVARICSEPGVTVKVDWAFRPWSSASRAMEAARDMSSYDELVQDPIRPTLSSSGQPLVLTASLNLEMGVARSGVKGPLMWGSSSERLISMSWSYSAPSSSRSSWANARAKSPISVRLVAAR